MAILVSGAISHHQEESLVAEGLQIGTTGVLIEAGGRVTGPTEPKLRLPKPPAGGEVFRDVEDGSIAGHCPRRQPPQVADEVGVVAEVAGRIEELLRLPGGMSDDDGACQDGHRQVRDVRDDDGQKRALGDGLLRVLYKQTNKQTNRLL